MVTHTIATQLDHGSNLFIQYHLLESKIVRTFVLPLKVKLYKKMYAIFFPVQAVILKCIFTALQPRLDVWRDLNK